ncbi:hypothetical protein HYE67_003401 [Fusarium culmorum]|uniref:Uncharacterized protein n=2 Tax=Fusarium sambucinum species complex TaxID=569360 RepID=K3V711_FUSPC|nr:hypothetical protein FPSE_10906 [Fusarium pseudograminearum CS3096]EKJ68909.1 hypothetical protein FPSE_10906 [Fusarium pseudograminearum CS3096]QPC61170.1 hypothetical protein HYE67_003401 [Fusarium culmorum]QPC78529.1 hypothetical protein HYE68_009281 [Fusarium pseudograminearum]
MASLAVAMSVSSVSQTSIARLLRQKGQQPIAHLRCRYPLPRLRKISADASAVGSGDPLKVPIS